VLAGPADSERGYDRDGGEVVMRVVVIGGTGHIGGYLVPRLVERGDEVIVLSRGERAPYRKHPTWDAVRSIQVDRAAEDRAGTFGARIAEFEADAVIDLICFDQGSAEQLVAALLPHGPLLVSCGSIWVHGPGTAVPTREDEARETFGEYGLGKARIEEFLLGQSAAGVPSIVLHPGHISGPGWRVINPIANLDLEVWEKLACGDEVVMPHYGLETVHHVHADDVALAFELALTRPDAVGEAFHVVSDRAITLRGFARAVAGWFGREATLRFAGLDDFRSGLSADAEAATLDHITRSPSMSWQKAHELLGYTPRYSSLDAVREAVAWLQHDGQLQLGAQRL
jgi:Nucleoside-diphosphate-sugar epimerases